MMDEIDFELCLDIDKVASTSRQKKRHSNATNTNITTTTARTRTHEEIDDATADEGTLNQPPPAKKAKTAPFDSKTEIQPMVPTPTPNPQGTIDWVQYAQLLSQYWGYYFSQNPQNPTQMPAQMPAETNTAMPSRARAASEETEIDYNMLYKGSESGSDTEMEMEPKPEPEMHPETFYDPCPVHGHDYIPWPVQNGAVLDAGSGGDFPSKGGNLSDAGFTIYEDPEDVDFDGVIPEVDWYVSPEDDKENLENGYDESDYLRDRDVNVAVV